MSALRQDWSRLLAPLRDLKGVYGCFVIAADGVLVASDVPFVVEEEQLLQVGRYLIEVWDAAPSSLGPDQLTIEFAIHRLYCRRHPVVGTLCVLIAGEEGMAALTAASRLVCDAAAAFVTAPATALAAAPQHSSGLVPFRPVLAPGPRKSRPLIYRGRRYD